MSRAKHVLAGFAVLALVSLGSVDAAAQTRVETVRWWHPNPSAVDGYKVYYGTSSGSYTTSTDVGIPATDSQGAYTYGLSVPSSQTVYIAITAYAGNQESPFSNEKVRVGTQGGTGGGTGGGGTGGGGTSGGGPQAAIQGFTLWNADSDTVIDSNFQSGDQISLDTDGSCLAIEVVGNSYLAASNSPGSVMFAFDGNVPNACDTPGTTHENEAPFTWETDTGPGQFECAASLTQPGTHTLTATPFDGDDCTGTMGTPATVQFQVVAPTSGGGTTVPPTLGEPGKPYLVY
jgi:hypothetical protein